MVPKPTRVAWVVYTRCYYEFGTNGLEFTWNEKNSSPKLMKPFDESERELYKRIKEARVKVASLEPGNLFE
ncbi:hypothetical protein OSB04_012662 [Centaurea solstitialis]|uniref:Uncharacterized protein n=1 Tax=Centaurea solstitialis TaxID=347529 RepID=A0AA38TJA5_9ASTR|nr:hypothetical protein OSB04_012662 [Centaurea solstitialis]